MAPTVESDVDSGADSAVRLCLFVIIGATETVDTDVAIRVERTGTVGNGVPLREGEDRGRRHLGEKIIHGGFHGGRNNKLYNLFQKRFYGANALGHVRENCPVAAKAYQTRAQP